MHLEARSDTLLDLALMTLDEVRLVRAESVAQRFETDVRACSRALYTMSYEEYRRRIDERIPGTCRWFIEHPQYKAWNASPESGVLWLSADPGCRKSVLAKFLIDKELPHQQPREVLDFFFKDDNEDQKHATNGLCAIFHQLLSADPVMLEHVAKIYEDRIKQLPTSKSLLWEALMTALTKMNEDFVCVFDALDGCQEQSRYDLIDTFCDFHRAADYGTKVRVLVTSRPYYDIERRFKALTARIPSVHLKADTASDKISREIHLVIAWKVNVLRQLLDLDVRLATTLSDKLRAMEHPTYLWLTLVLEVIGQELEVT